MSGIYITGMEMPTSCAECRFYGEYCYAKGDENKYSKLPCPLIPVPDHGRLIDADALTGPMERNLWSIEDKAEKELGFNETLRRGMQYGHAVCVDAVNAAPTIIPADKEGEG